jgi:glucose-1-phosphate cytidylyltransferase
MQVVILAGGAGTRMGSTEDNVPKPMVKIGDRPILWHIMKHYEVYGHTDFILCMGYKGDAIRDYFMHYRSRVSDVLVETKTGNTLAVIGPKIEEDWKVWLAETGQVTGTGGRLKRIQKYIEDEHFLVTYGDSLSDVPITNVIKHHLKMNLVATMSVMHSSQRFGKADVADGKVVSFVEKPQSTDWINGGFYVFRKDIFDWIGVDGPLEYGPLTELASQGQLAAYEHIGCHRAMDTPRDVKMLNEEWETGHAAWKTW